MTRESTAMNHAAAKRASRAARADGLAAGLLRWWDQHRGRQQHQASERQLVLVESLVLNVKQRVVLVQCGAERFLIGTGQDGVPSMVRLSAGDPERTEFGEEREHEERTPQAPSGQRWR
jgi:flagellar biogenesis protein FliO